MAHEHIRRLNERLATFEAENGELRKAIADSLAAGNQLPIAADCIARLIRGEAPAIRKSLEQKGTKTIAFGGENLGDRENVKKAKAAREAGGNPYNL